MIKPEYRAQVDLLLDVLPYTAKEECFALKGGTALNMFVWDMQRLSVDIDLTYIHFDDRASALENISGSILRIKKNIAKNLSGMQLKESGLSENQADKMLCIRDGVRIKIEVNTTMRGVIKPTQKMPTNQSVLNEFGKFASMQVQSEAELFGGKICAALDRQHPRDLFDIHHLFNIGKISGEIKDGFIAALLSHNKSIHEVLDPTIQDQRKAFARQFEGMTNQPFSYEDFEKTREDLIKEVHAMLTDNDKQLLLGIKSGDPDWSLSCIEKLPDLPAVKWKLQNIRKLRSDNPKQHSALLDKLTKVLSH